MVSLRQRFIITSRSDFDFRSSSKGMCQITVFCSSLYFIHEAFYFWEIYHMTLGMSSLKIFIFYQEVQNLPNKEQCCKVSEWQNHTTPKSPITRWLLTVQPGRDKSPCEQSNEGQAVPPTADRTQLFPDWRRQSGQ